MPPYQEKNFEFRGDVRLPNSMDELDTPGEFFSFLFTKEIFAYIVEESNLKALQDNINKPANITIEELEQFVGIILYMSLVKLPSTRKHWEKGTAQQEVFETMTCNRWDAIQTYLHFNDNANFQPRDYKLAVSEHLRKVNKSFSRKRGRPSKGTSPKATPTSSRGGTPSDRMDSSHPKRQRTRKQDRPLSTVRKDIVGHFPRWMKTRLMCQNDCTYRSYTKCEKCKVYLCYNDKRNYFTEFHLT